jgi:hypothetical protein
MILGHDESMWLHDLAGALGQCSCVGLSFLMGGGAVWWLFKAMSGHRGPN